MNFNKFMLINKLIAFSPLSCCNNLKIKEGLNHKSLY